MKSVRSFSPKALAPLAIADIVGPLSKNMIPVIGVSASEGKVYLYLDIVFADRALQVLSH